MEGETMTLREYWEDKNMSIIEFSIMVGVSIPQLYKIGDNRRNNITIDTARKIYQNTLVNFGEGLDVWEYIDRDLIINK